jgi:putative beta-lysine N-acetyltransferase
VKKRRHNMYDVFKKIGSSLIYYGKHNDRVYIMKVFDSDFDRVIKKSEELAIGRNYGKIFAKFSKKFLEKIDNTDYLVEAEIPNFYTDGSSCVFVSKYFDVNRKIEINQEKINNILSKAIEKKKLKEDRKNDYIIKKLTKKNSTEMADIYKKVFASYPFPIFDSEYLCETMDDNIEYVGAFENEKLIGIASAEKYPESSSVEMTDFAVLPKYRGSGIAISLLKALEKELRSREEYRVFYTIARAMSHGMNITFSRNGYDFAGTLINNTNISGSLESMNVWYKHI